MWLAVDRDRNKIIDIRISKQRTKDVFLGMAHKLELRGYKINILCTDGYEGYAYYKLAENHFISKTETSLVNSKNSLIRHYLARFNRRTKRHSKAFDMIFASLLVLFYKNLLLSIII